MDTEQIPLNSGFGFDTTAEEIISGYDLKGKIIVITGGHSGIGLETTRVLSKAGATIFVGSRDIKKAQIAFEEFKNVSIIQLDLSDPDSIDTFTKEFLDSNKKLDILINNAGIMATPLMRNIYGYELQFATNHLGHFQLTSLLWNALKNAKNSRVITLSSFGHRFAGVDFDDPNFINKDYDKWLAYGQSKTANSLFTVELDSLGKEYNIRAFAVHPGRILNTDLIRYMDSEEMKSLGIYRENGIIKGSSEVKSIEQGAATSIWCSISPQLINKGGVYCADCDISQLVSDNSPLQSGIRSWAVDKSKAKKLWELSEKLTNIKWPE